MRAQTTLDFAIGVAVFLAVLLFVFGFVPGILSPFEVADEELPAQSDRVANTLAQERLGGADSPYELDRYCTVEFFEGGDEPEDCNFDSTDLNEEFGFSEWRSVNVTLRGQGGEPLCWDGERIIDECTDSDVALATGEAVPDGGVTTMTARRVVALDGQQVTLEVVLW